MSDAGGTAGKPRAERRGATLQLTVILALILLLLGGAGGGSLSLLRYAMREPTADDIAQLVCNAYERQDYTLLLNHIDPTPVPPENASAFDTAAKDRLRTQLEGLDASSGKVTKCSERSLAVGSGTAQPAQLQYAYMMTRANAPEKPFNTLMTLVRVPGKGWMVSRNSNFSGTQG